MDQLADELGHGPAGAAAQELHPADSFPHETAIGVVYDSGDYEGALDKLLEHFDEAEVRREAEQLRERGMLPRHRLLHLHRDLRPRALAGRRPERLRPAGRRCWESAMVRVHVTGAVTVYTGTSPHGQGHETTFAQIVADRLGIEPGERRGHPRRHRTPARRGSAPTGRARSPSAARRAARAGREGRRQGAGDRRAPARGRARGHRARRTASSPSRARRTRA